MTTLEPLPSLAPPKPPKTKKTATAAPEPWKDLLVKARDALVEILKAPSLKIIAWETRRRRANRPNANIVTATVKDLDDFLSQAQFETNGGI